MKSGECKLKPIYVCWLRLLAVILGVFVGGSLHSASGGGLLGSWVNESGSSQRTEEVVGKGFGAGSDVFFLHQSGARFRQGWALKQVEQAWGALQQSRLSLNVGPRFPDDPRSKRILAGDVRLNGARWADAVYADALLQATLKSATEEGRRGVRAHFTPTVEGRRFDGTGVDLTAKATTALNASFGGGPVDWQRAIPAGQDHFLTAVETNLRRLESSDGEIFREGLRSQIETLISSETFLRGQEMPDGSRTGLLFAGAMYDQYSELKDAGVDDRGTWAAMTYGSLPIVGSGTSAAYAVATGTDFRSGFGLSGKEQLLQVGLFAADTVLSGALSRGGGGGPGGVLRRSADDWEVIPKGHSSGRPMKNVTPSLGPRMLEAPSGRPALREGPAVASPSIPALNAVENTVPQFQTPFRPLSQAQSKVFREKLANRTITKSEYQHLDWDRRFGNRRERGVQRFWAQERRALRSGQAGTRNWSPAQQADIVAGRRPKFAGETIEGHHRYNALDHPQLADDAGNIYPATIDEHLRRWHGGNFQNDTFGVPLNPGFAEQF